MVDVVKKRDAKTTDVLEKGGRDITTQANKIRDAAAEQEAALGQAMQSAKDSPQRVGLLVVLVGLAGAAGLAWASAAPSPARSTA